MKSNLSILEEDFKKLLLKSCALELSVYKELKIPELIEIADKEKIPSFRDEYENWYSESHKVIKQILPDRLGDFEILYRNGKRKEINASTYTISDYLARIQVKIGNHIVVDESYVFSKFTQQVNILKSVEQTFKSSLFNIKHMLQADIFDNELQAANELLRNGFMRASGAVAGVVLEKHLKDVCNAHEIKIIKKNACLGDYIELLKSNDIIDVANWRFLQYMGSIRNLCDHSKDREPTSEEIKDLLKGADKIIKTIF